MTKITKNDQVILWSAEEDLKDQRFHQVVNKMEHLMAIYPDDVTIHLLLASGLSGLKRYPEAYQMILTFRDRLADAPSYLPEGVRISLKNEAFMLAREIIHDPLFNNPDQFRTAIDEAENQFRFDRSVDLQKRMRAFAHAGSLAADQQAQTLISALKLPLREYMQAARGVLSDPFGWQVTKTQVLLELKAIGNTETVTLNWLDNESYQLRIGDLPILETVSPLIEALNDLHQQYAGQDPVKYQLIEQQILTEAQYIYPFFDKVITDPKFWVKIVGSHLFGDEVAAKSVDQRQMLTWIEKINQAESFMKFV